MQRLMKYLIYKEFLFWLYLFVPFGKRLVTAWGFRSFLIHHWQLYYTRPIVSLEQIICLMYYQNVWFRLRRILCIVKSDDFQIICNFIVSGKVSLNYSSTYLQRKFDVGCFRDVDFAFIHFLFWIMIVNFCVCKTFSALQ